MRLTPENKQREYSELLTLFITEEVPALTLADQSKGFNLFNPVKSCVELPKGINIMIKIKDPISIIMCYMFFMLQI